AFVELPIEQTIHEVNSLLPLGEDRFIITAQNGVFELQLKAGPQLDFCRRLKGPEDTSCAIRVGNGELFVGTKTQGLFRLSTNRSAQWEAVSFLPFQEIVALDYDPNNGLWVSSSDQLALLKPTFFESYELNVSEVPIEAFALQDDGQLWMSSSNELFQFTRSDDHTPNPELYLRTSAVAKSLYADGPQLWLGYLNGQVEQIDLTTRAVKSLSQLPAHTTFITDLLKDQLGNLWVAGNQAVGLMRLDPSGKAHFYNAPGLEEVNVLLETTDGVVWVGGGNRDNFLQVYIPTEDSFLNLNLLTDFEPSKNFTVEDMLLYKGDIMLGTTDGLLHLNLRNNGDENRLRRIDLRKVPIDESIKAIVSTEDGDLWVSTTSGLIAYNEEQSLLFDSNSGLPSNSLTHRGLQIDEAGNLWVATARGMAVVQKNRLNKNQHL
ncbi:MAG: hypothetical protein AAFO94_18840, partial [Bacteroidota bacterium]